MMGELGRRATRVLGKSYFGRHEGLGSPLELVERRIGCEGVEVGSHGDRNTLQGGVQPKVAVCPRATGSFTRN
jgi:hypothetical protein